MAAVGLERKTASGIVSGRRDGAALAFLGIPYAAPPVGEARFAEPKPPVAWAGVRDATAFGPPAPQTPLPMLLAPPATAQGDEWLTLNVWTPEDRSDTPLPVMVWLHGGALLLGTAAEPDYNGRRLAAEGNVVVVTLNFRIGFEGFGQLPEAPANRGLLDVVAALKWIRQNIGEFGGDRERVTVFGQSAGAQMAAALLAMPLASGLFRRMVLQSPPGTLVTSELAADVTSTLLDCLGHHASVEDLRDIDPRELSAELTPLLLPELSRHRERWGQLSLGIAPFAPVIDGDTLPRTPWDALASGAGRDIELIIGHTRDESRLFLTLAGALVSVTDEQANAALQDHAPAPNGASAYRAAFPEAQPAQLFEVVQSDAAFRMPAIHLADAQVAGGGRAFFYEVTWSSPATGGAFGASHTIDYGLVFGIRSAGLSALLHGEVPEEKYEALCTAVRNWWVAFAATGAPGWAPYDSSHRLVQLIDLDGEVVPYPEEPSRRIWADKRPEALPLLAPRSY